MTSVRFLNAETETVEIGSIEPHPENPNQGDRAAIGESIEANGFFGFVLCQRSRRRILAGEHRWRELRAMGAETVPVLWLDIDDEAALRILLADNRTARLGFTDDTLLARLLRDLASKTGTLGGTGYTHGDLDDLLAGVGDAISGVQESLGEMPEASSSGESTHYPADTVVKVGEYRFLVERQSYLDWLEEVRREAGYDAPSIRNEIRRRLGLACDS